jgi:hypothetical protein
MEMPVDEEDKSAASHVHLDKYKSYSPWNFPASSGKTFTIACAAPVDAGIMFPMTDRPYWKRCLSE